MAFGQPLMANPLDSIQPINMPHPMAQAAAKPKHNWLGILADALSGAAGQTPLYTQSLMLQRQMAQQQQLAQQNSDRELQRGKDLYSYEAANPKPDAPSATERMIAELVTMPKDDPRRPYYENAVQHPVGMDVTQPDGSVVRQYVYPNSIPQQQQPRVFTQLPPDAVPENSGGPTPPASGTFPKPRRHRPH